MLRLPVLTHESLDMKLLDYSPATYPNLSSLPVIKVLYRDVIAVFSRTTLLKQLTQPTYICSKGAAGYF